MTKQFCVHGHDTHIVGRYARGWNPMGACRQCVRDRQIMANRTPEQIERRREQYRTANLSPEQIERRNKYARERWANRTPAQRLANTQRDTLRYARQQVESTNQKVEELHA